MQQNGTDPISCMCGAAYKILELKFNPENWEPLSSIFCTIAEYIFMGWQKSIREKFADYCKIIANWNRMQISVELERISIIFTPILNDCFIRNIYLHLMDGC